MGSAARRRLAILVPWVALAALSLAVLLRSTVGPDGQAPAASRAAAPAGPPPATATRPDPRLAALAATDEALDAALLDLEAARAEAASLRTGAQKALEALDRRGADLALAEARAEALARAGEARGEEVGRLEEAATSLRRRIEELQAEVETARDPVRHWIRAAGSEDVRERAEALSQVARATPEQVARLGALLEEDPASWVAVARLVAGLPPGEAADALAHSVLVRAAATEGGADDVAALGPRLLSRPAVLAAALAQPSDTVRRAVLQHLVLPLPAAETDLEPVREAIANLLAGGTDEDVAVGAQAVGLLRLDGFAGRLADLLEAEDPVVRLRAAHALSRVPDLESAREEALRALPTLLDSPSAPIRTAGLLLAEALLEERVDFDPNAGPAARREALDRLLDRLR